MYQIDTPNNSATQPPDANSGAPGYFKDGDATAGAPGTTVSAYWLNTVQQELLNVVTVAGITPSKVANTQVRQAIQSLISASAASTLSSAQSFATNADNALLASFVGTNALNGSRLLPNGTIIKWGQGLTVTGNGDAVAFPGGAFPNGVFSVVVNERNASGWLSNTCTVLGASAQTTAGFNVHCRAFNAGTFQAGASVAYAWIAVGH